MRDVFRIYRRKTDERGMALIAALALLVVFSLLGAAYVRSMMLEMDRTNMLAAQLRAREAAAAGVRAAICKLEMAVAAHEAEALLAQPLNFDLPGYAADAQGGLTPSSNWKVSVEAVLSDESARLNLNHAPSSVLALALGIDGEKARALAASLPRAGASGEGAWLTSPDELVLRGILTPETYQHLNPNWFTVYTVPEPAQPAAWFNVNGAPPELLAAVLHITPEAAQAVVRARPFINVAQLAQAAGKEPSTFGLKPDEASPDGLPAALAFEPVSFRIQCRASAAYTGGSASAKAQAEAVVCFNNRKEPAITYWNESSLDGEAAEKRM